MGGLDRSFAEGDRVEPLVKEITQDSINLFEGSAGHSGPSQFTDEEAARETLGTSGTVASGRMSRGECPSASPWRCSAGISAAMYLTGPAWSTCAFFALFVPATPSPFPER